VPNLKWLNLTGEGTSVLNPYFFEMVHMVKSRGIYLDFSHDFVRLSDKQAENLVKWNVDRIYWSLDGVTKKTYEKIRVGADFDKVVENVKTLVALKKYYESPLPEICFRFTFFKDNIHEVTLIPNFLYNLVGGDVKRYGDEPSINIVALLEFEETKDWAVELPEWIPVVFNKDCKKYGFTPYWSHITHIEENKAPLDYCTFWSEPYIMITGHVVPCCAVLMSNKRPELERLAFGNIHEQSLKDIWFSDRYRKFRKMVVNPRAPAPKVCMGCRSFNTKGRAERYGVI
jgi:MoaA/NifB/PqqE/SkfB family radical SAM enzyme